MNEQETRRATYLAQYATHLAIVMLELVKLAADSARPSEDSTTQPRSDQSGRTTELAEVKVALSTYPANDGLGKSRESRRVSVNSTPLQIRDLSHLNGRGTCPHRVLSSDKRSRKSVSVKYFARPLAERNSRSPEAS